MFTVAIGAKFPLELDRIGDDWTRLELFENGSLALVANMNRPTREELETFHGPFSGIWLYRDSFLVNLAFSFDGWYPEAAVDIMLCSQGIRDAWRSGTAGNGLSMFLLDRGIVAGIRLVGLGGTVMTAMRNAFLAQMEADYTPDDFTDALAKLYQNSPEAVRAMSAFYPFEKRSHKEGK